jgi:hypothetical protein
MRAKLTEEDVSWLEQRLSAAMVPVVPRAAFVHDAKQALLSEPACGESSQRAAWAPAILLALAAVAVAMFATAMLRRHAHASDLSALSD